MKRITIIVAILFSLTACNSNEKAAELQKQREDSIRAAQQKQAEKNAAAQQTVTTVKVSETDANTAKEKKGMSSTAKGAIIGAGVGAVTGAVVSKKHGKGAVIGGIIGAGVGAGTGAVIDKKKKKRRARH